jgi:hypothetical protein
LEKCEQPEQVGVLKPTRTLARRLGAGAAGLVLMALLAPPATGQERSAPIPDSRQAAYAQAAQQYGVPVEILLAASYLETRWDTHAGEPSRGAGYGPMHLTDVAEANKPSAVRHYDDEDPRGDSSRPMKQAPDASPRERVAEPPPGLDTVGQAARLTGIAEQELRADPAANIRGGAALLAQYQKQLGGAGAKDPSDWYGAVARYSGATDAGTARGFADEAYTILAQGVTRTTDDGHSIRLASHRVPPDRSWLAKTGLRPAKGASETECPATVSCEWIPAAYQELPDNDYGHYDLANRPAEQKIRFIVIHDTEGDYQHVLDLTQDPNYAASWQYTLRNSDGHIAQHIKAKDVAWQAGNWYINAKSIGLEHEGYAARGTWYSEAMYRQSAKLVKFLAGKYDIPIDRQHILSHDTVPGPLPANIPTMHWDPGPFWDWARYFELLGKPLQATGSSASGLVTIKPDFDSNFVPFLGCEEEDGPPEEDPDNPPRCGRWGSSSVILRTEPSADAPLLQDIGLHPDGSPTTMRVSDIGSRVSTGQQYAVAEVRGDWTAIWYLGQKGWFHNPAGHRNALWAKGFVVTPKAGKTEVPVYGRAYPEAEAYAGTTIPVQAVTPLPYNLHAGERYAFGGAPESEYYRAVTFDVFDGTDHVVVRGKTRYYQIQVGHRVGYVMASDVDVMLSVKR